MPAAVIGSDGTPLERGGNVWKAHPRQLTVISDPGHPLFDKSVKVPLDPAFKQSIRTHGVMQAVCVRKNGSLLEVVYGRDRTRAAQELADEGVNILIPVVTFRGSDLDAMLAMVAENCDRKTIGPVERAFYAERLRRFGASDDQCAKALHVDRQTVRADKVILDLADPIVEDIRTGVIPAKAVQTLASLPRDQQVAVVNEAKAKSSTPRVSAQQIKDAADPNAKLRPTPGQLKAIINDPRFTALKSDPTALLALLYFYTEGDRAELLLHPEARTLALDIVMPKDNA